jgi:hypothetical protein
VLERVGVVGRLVVADARDAREAEREPGAVGRAPLEIAEEHLDDDARLDEHRRALLAHRERRQARRHRAELVVGQTLERLPDRLEPSRLLVARGEVVVAEPAVASP